MTQTLYTIGHSNRTEREFEEALSAHFVDSIADVRSAPYSRFLPHFDRIPLSNRLEAGNRSYVFLGHQLGGRTDDPSCYANGQVDYDLVEQTSAFRQGIDRIMKGVQRHKIAMLCAEKDPIHCHRMILICRHLRSSGLEIIHIHDKDHIETHPQAERRLLKSVGMAEEDLFSDFDELVKIAYRKQMDRIAYKTDNSEAPDGMENN